MVEKEKLQEIVGSVLVKQFGEVEIESIKIQRRLDGDGDEMLLINIIFDNGSKKPLQPRKMARFISQLFSKMRDVGETAIPVPFLFNRPHMTRSELRELRAAPA